MNGLYLQWAGEQLEQRNWDGGGFMWQCKVWQLAFFSYILSLPCRRTVTNVAWLTEHLSLRTHWGIIRAVGWWGIFFRPCKLAVGRDTFHRRWTPYNSLHQVGRFNEALYFGVKLKKKCFMLLSCQLNGRVFVLCGCVSILGKSAPEGKEQTINHQPRIGRKTRTTIWRSLCQVNRPSGSTVGALT